MLSAAWQDLLAATGAPSVPSVVHLERADGGYVSLNSFQSSDARDLFGGAAADRTVVPQNGAAGFSTSDSIGSYFVNRASTAGVIIFNADGTFTTLIPAASFDQDVATEFDGTNDIPATPTYVMQPIGEEPAAENEEGGVIPIHSMLSQLFSSESEGEQESLARGRKSAATSDVPLAATTAPAAELTGEWARAIAFDFLGAEDAEGDSSTRSVGIHERASLEQAVADEMDERLTLLEAQRGQQVHDTNRADGSTANEAAAATQSEIAPTPNDFSGIPLGVEHLRGGALSIMNAAAPEVRAALEGMRLAIAATPSAVMGSITDCAIAELFSGLAGEGVEPGRPLADVRAWEPWNVTPLLLIVALERISASNSRRAQGRDSNERFATPSLPRRHRRYPDESADH